MSAYTGYISRTYLQLDERRQDALSDHAATLLAEQREEEAVVLHGALTTEQINEMTLGELLTHAGTLGVRPSAMLRVAEARG